MRLNQLKISGFKSFAETTLFQFDSKRSAIVGPNGCGKSNVIDAIRWVIGESSAKQLRGDTMQDVIFAGTSTRHSSSVATVELRFDNTDGQLAGQYKAYQEISIKRQVTRDGKSDYFLNGSRCRRKDIIDIFLGTGLGPRSYAVIEQGMIHRLIESKPDEMRVFIEEAAGVSRYQARRKTTLQHLQHTTDNLSRLHDIEHGLAQQIRHLTRQAARANHYQQLQAHQIDLEQQQWSHKYHQHQQELEQADSRLSILQQQDHTLQRQFDQARADEQQLQQQLQQHLIEASVLQQNLQQATADRQAVELENKHQHRQYQQLEQAHMTVQQSLQDLQHQHKELEAQLHRLDQELRQQRERNHQLQQDDDTQQPQFLRWLEQFEQQQTQLSTLEQYIKQKIQLKEQLQRQCQHLDKARQRTALHLTQLIVPQPIDEGQQLLELDTEYTQLKSQYATLEQQRLSCDQLIEQQDENYHQLMQQQHQLTIQLRHLESERQRIQKRLVTLPSQQATQPDQSLWQVIELTELGRSHSQLIEDFLTLWLDAAIVSEAPSQSGIFYPKQLWIESAQEAAMKVAPSLECGSLSAFSLTSWIKYPIHRLWSQVYIVEQQQDAIALQGQLSDQVQLLSYDGYWCGKDWAIDLRAAAKLTDQPQAHLHDRYQLIECTETIEQAKSQLEPIQQQVAQYKSALQDLKQRYQQIQQQQQQCMQQQHHNRQQSALLQQRIAQYHTECQRIERDRQTFTQQYADEEHEYTQVNQHYQHVQDELADIQSERQHTVELCQALKQKVTSVQSRVNQLRDQRRKIQDQIRQGESQYALLMQQQTFNDQQQQAHRIQSQQLLLQLTQITHQIEHNQAIQAQAQCVVDDAQQAWQFWQAHSQQLQQKLKTQQIALEAVEKQLHHNRDQLEQARLDWHYHRQQQDHIMEQLRQLGIDQPRHDVTQSASINSQLEQCRQQLAQLGAINLAAADELDQIQQQHLPLEHQIKDLEHTVQQLHDAIKDIDIETKQRFMDTLHAVNTQLQQLFSLVFGGGEATLTLESDWQSGVKLMVRPPGKRNSHLALLSGGEKALTALALIFAIFQLNPAPFCVLDEVDAPLDDANVERFCNLVTMLSQQVQFIYITHNKIAMQMANQLLGVTMPQAGVSKLVAVSLDQAQLYTDRG